MARKFSTTELEAFLDEALPPERMASIEGTLREDDALAQRLAEVSAQRDAGLHSLGAIWRRHRLTCPTREQLGSYLLSVLPDDFATYVSFHVETAECRFCQASLADLQNLQKAAEDDSLVRRRKFFDSSVSELPKP